MESTPGPKRKPSQRQATRPLFWVSNELLWALLSSAAFAAAACEVRPHVTLHTTGGPVRVWVEIADTPEARARGLMYRRELAADGGMLFVFPQEERLEFWMKNTLLPLDMIFIGADLRVVGIVERAQPLSTVPRGPGVPAQYVLEVNGGFAASHGLQAGDRVEFRGVPAAQR